MYKSQTEIGKTFNISAEDISKVLNLLGLKENNKPTDKAIVSNICINNKGVWIWDADTVIPLIESLGYNKKGKAKKSEKIVSETLQNYKGFIAFTDANCQAWASVILSPDNIKSYLGGQIDQDHNINEFLAVKETLLYIPEKSKVRIFTDSHNLKSNKDLKDLAKLRFISFELFWVKSHSGLTLNAEADMLSAYVRDLWN